MQTEGGRKVEQKQTTKENIRTLKKFVNHNNVQ